MIAAFGAKASQEVGAGGTYGDHAVGESCAVGYVPQEEHPHDGEQQDAGEHEEAGVAEGELEANAQTRALYPRSAPSRPVSGCVSMR